MRPDPLTHHHRQPKRHTIASQRIVALLTVAASLLVFASPALAQDTTTTLAPQNPPTGIGSQPLPPTVAAPSDIVSISGLDYLQAGFDQQDRDPDLYDSIDQVRLNDGLGDPTVTRLKDGRWVIPFEATGVGRKVRLTGQVNELSLTVPIPEGTTPSILRATMSVSPDVSSGYFEYFGGGSRVRTVDLGTREQRGQSIEIQLDLSGMKPTNGKISITFRNRLRSDDYACTTTLIGAWVDFSNGVFVFEGDPVPPINVGQFMPQLLEKLTVYTPAQPSVAEAEAATRIVNSVVRSTLGHNPAVTIRPMHSSDRVPSRVFDPTGRTVVISHDLPSGAQLVQTGTSGIVMVIGGDSDSIERSSKAWAGDLSDLMAGTIVDVIRYDRKGEAQVRPDGVPMLVDIDGDGIFDSYDVDNPPVEVLAMGAPETTADTGLARDVGPSGTTTTTTPMVNGRVTHYTLEDLGINRLRVTGIGRMELPMFIDQASFGGPVDGISAHLEGTYTPIAPGAQATMNVFFNGIMVNSVNLFGGDGTYSYDFELDPQLLARNTGLVVVVDYTPPSGWCRPGEIPFILQINPFSYFDITPGEGIDVGFERYPQNLVDSDFAIALDDFSISRLSLATRLVAALQRTTNVALDASFIRLDQSTNVDGPLIMVTASGPDYLSSAPLLSTNPISVIDNDRIELLRFNVDLGHAVLEAFDYHGSDRLMLTWNSGHDPDPAVGIEFANQLLDSISTRDDSWSNLFGDTYMLSDGAPPLALAVRGENLQATPSILAPDYIAKARPLVIAMFFAAIVAFVLNLLRKWRIRTREEEDARQAMRLSMARIADQLDIPDDDDGDDLDF